MTNIKNIFKQGLSLAIVALAILFTFAFNPAVAHAEGYCCGGDITYLGYEGGNSCQVEYAPGYEYTSAKLTSFDYNYGVDFVYGDLDEGAVAIPAGESVTVNLPVYGEFFLDGEGPVYFDCAK